MWLNSPLDLAFILAPFGMLELRKPSGGGGPDLKGVGGRDGIGGARAWIDR